MKSVKIIIALLILLVLTALAVGGYVLATFDPNDHKDRIIETVREQTGRTLTINGDIELSLFPWLGVQINKVSLGNPPGLDGNLSAQHFATIGEARVHLKLLPLLKQQIVVDTVSLQQLHVSLLTDNNGHNNWTFARSTTQTAAPATAKPPAADNKAAAQALAALSVGGIMIRDASLDWKDLSTTTNISLNNISLSTGPLALNQETPVKLSFNVRGLTNQELPISLLARIKANTKLNRFDINELKLKSKQVAADASITALIDNGSPRLNGQLSLLPFNPRQALANFGISNITTSSDKALRKASGQLRFHATDQQFSVDDIRLQLDDSTIHGESDIRFSSVPKIGFTLDLDHINIDDYLPPSTPASSAPASPATATAAAAIELPVDTLRELNLNGQARVGKLVVSGLTVKDFDVTVSARDGLIRLHPLTAELYQGRYSGDLRLDVRPSLPQYAMRESLQGIQIGPFLKALAGKDLLSGQADVNFDLNTSGGTVAQLTNKLNGTAAATLNDGALKGINIADMIRQAQAKLAGKAVPPATTKETDFTTMKATIKVSNGIARNNDLDARAPYLRISGEGTANLVTQKLDYRLTTRVVESASGQGGNDLDSLKGVDIPIRISGAFAAPAIGLDNSVIKKQLEAQAKKQVQKAVDKEKARLQQKAEDEKQRLKKEAEEKLRDKLKSLF